MSLRTCPSCADLSAEDAVDCESCGTRLIEKHPRCSCANGFRCAYCLGLIPQLQGAK